MLIPVAGLRLLHIQVVRIVPEPPSGAAGHAFDDGRAQCDIAAVVSCSFQQTCLYTAYTAC